jgi:hypothetical protein
MANKWHGAHNKTICASMMRAVVRFDNIQGFAQKCDRLRANSPRAELEVTMYVLKHYQHVGDLTETGALVRSAPGRLRSARRRQRSRRLRLWSLHGGAAQPFHSAVRSRRSTVSSTMRPSHSAVRSPRGRFIHPCGRLNPPLRPLRPAVRHALKAGDGGDKI